MKKIVKCPDCEQERIIKYSAPRLTICPACSYKKRADIDWSTERRLYMCWYDMCRRSKRFKQYRKVKVCKEWKVFRNFADWAMANGYQDTLTLERLDNSKGYNPDNCAWANWADQARNRTTTALDFEAVDNIRRLWKKGHSQAEISELLGISNKTVWRIVHEHQWSKPGHLYDGRMQ